MRDVTEEEFADQLGTSISYCHLGSAVDVGGRESFLRELWEHIGYLSPKQPIVVVSPTVADFLADANGFQYTVHEGNGLTKLGVLRPLTYFPQTGIRMHVYKSDSLDKVRALVFSDSASQPIKLTLGF